MGIYLEEISLAPEDLEVISSYECFSEFIDEFYSYVRDIYKISAFFRATKRSGENWPEFKFFGHLFSKKNNTVFVEELSNDKVGICLAHFLVREFCKNERDCKVSEES